MDPPPVEGSGRRASGRGGKGRGASRLGLKRARSPAPSPSPASSLAPPPVAAPTVPTAPIPVAAAPTPARGLPTSSPSPTSSMWQQPSHGVGRGAIPPNSTSLPGNLESPNSWGYPPGGFVSLIHQPNYPPQPQVHGENFHLVGQNMSFNPISQLPSNAYRTTTLEAAKQGTSTDKPVNIDSDEVDNSEAIKSVKKRYWTPEEEERLVENLFLVISHLVSVLRTLLCNIHCYSFSEFI